MRGGVQRAHARETGEGASHIIRQEIAPAVLTMGAEVVMYCRAPHPPYPPRICSPQAPRPRRHAHPTRIPPVGHSTKADPGKAGEAGAGRGWCQHHDQVVTSTGWRRDSRASPRSSLRFLAVPCTGPQLMTGSSNTGGPGCDATRLDK